MHAHETSADISKDTLKPTGVSKYLSNVLDALIIAEDALRINPNHVANWPVLQEDVYFKDQIRIIDFVLVFDKNAQMESRRLVNNFIKSLREEGFDFEEEVSKCYPQLLFIKVHVNTKLLLMRSVVHDVTLECHGTDKDRFVVGKLWPNCFHTCLTRNNLPNPLISRAPKSMPCVKAPAITTAERIFLAYDIMKETKYGSQEHEFGLKSLVDNKFLEDAYPLHDGDYHWRKEGPLNDRQLLGRYWAKFHMMFKLQPIDLIQRYYGPEVAFYFLFIGFYIKMLFVASVFGLLAMFYGLATVDSDTNYYSKEICKTDLTLCPQCLDTLVCKYSPLIDYCESSRLDYVMDNPATFLYAMIMCFWSTFFLELWKRKQRFSLYRWNLLGIEDDITARPEFAASMKYYRINEDGTKVQVVNVCMKTLKLIATYSVIGILVVFVTFATLGTIFLRIMMTNFILNMGYSSSNTAYHVKNVAMACANLVIIGFMIGFEIVYSTVSRILTNFENPRTQTEYDKSYTYKQLILCFVNAYVFMYYTSFAKGRFFTYPGDSSNAALTLLRNEECPPTGCILDICMQLIMTLSGKTIFKMFYYYFKPYIIRYCKRRHLKIKKLAIWEVGYSDNQAPYYFLFKDFKELILQFGYIVLFTAAFPLTPLVALLINIVLLRVDAYKLTKFHRRPVPVRRNGIGAWLNVLTTITYAGIATNAFLISFSTQFVNRMMMFFSVEQHDAFSYIFSLFNTSDFPPGTPEEYMKKNTTCVYGGMRHPPDHANKYELSTNFFHEKFVQFLSVFVIEVMVLAFTGLVAAAIPDIPRAIQEQLALQRKIKAKQQREGIQEKVRISELRPLKE